MKNLYVLFFCLLLTFVAGSQQITGFYSGILTSDSTGAVQQYELALAEYRGRISGYSYVTFVSKEHFYWGIRKVKAVVEGDSLVVEEGQIVQNNFPEPPAKGVKRTITIPLNGRDTITTLNGSWRTNQTRTYYSVPGQIELKRSNDSAASPLIRHLAELKLIPKVSLPESSMQSAAAGPVPMLPFTQRKNKLLQTIETSSDSLVLSFYDNGMVDGDSVSVYLNSVQVISNARLRTVATTKTIALNGRGDTELLLVAENLGTMPPNTGLLIIADGAKRYELHFSADMQTNASILIRKN